MPNHPDIFTGKPFVNNMLNDGFYIVVFTSKTKPFFLRAKRHGLQIAGVDLDRPCAKGPVPSESEHFGQHNRRRLEKRWDFHSQCRCFRSIPTIGIYWKTWMLNTPKRFRIDSEGMLHLHPCCPSSQLNRPKDLETWFEKR